MKIRIEEGCIACGVCEEICPDVFTVDDNCNVNPDADLKSHADAIKEAAQECPVEVIIVED
jgi:ferredoxin